MVQCLCHDLVLNTVKHCKHHGQNQAFVKWLFSKDWTNLLCSYCWAVRNKLSCAKINSSEILLIFENLQHWHSAFMCNFEEVLVHWVNVILGPLLLTLTKGNGLCLSGFICWLKACSVCWLITNHRSSIMRGRL